MPDLVDLRDPLDTAALARWLGDALGFEAPFAVQQFAGGFSNVTVLVTDAAGREAVVRMPPPGAAVRGGHDMTREVRVLRALAGHVPVPAVLAFSESALGVPAYAMQRVRGTILRGATPRDERPDAPAMARTADALVETLAGLHALDPAAVDLGNLGRPEGYVARTVDGWARRYAAARTDDVPGLEHAFVWLAEHTPPEAGIALLHNDFKHDNLVLDPDTLADGPVRVRAILDWELATVGCPLMDVGASLGYWVEPGDLPALRQAALSPTAWPGSPTREAFAHAYALRTGRDVGPLAFYYVYGLTRLATIAQQIYRRWTLGHTADPRFGALGLAVAACGETAARVVETGRVSDLW